MLATVFSLVSTKIHFSLVQSTSFTTFGCLPQRLNAINRRKMLLLCIVADDGVARVRFINWKPPFVQAHRWMHKPCTRFVWQYHNYCNEPHVTDTTQISNVPQCFRFSQTTSASHQWSREYMPQYLSWRPNLMALKRSFHYERFYEYTIYIEIGVECRNISVYVLFIIPFTLASLSISIVASSLVFSMLRSQIHGMPSKQVN